MNFKVLFGNYFVYSEVGTKLAVSSPCVCLSSMHSSHMFSTSSHHISRFHRDHSTIGMSDHVWVGKDRVDHSSSSSMGCFGSLDLRSVSRDHSTIRVSDQGRGGERNTGSNYQELHVRAEGRARVQ